MICPNCGAETPDISKYCLECGARIAPAVPADEQQNGSFEDDGESEDRPSDAADAGSSSEAAQPSRKPRQRQRRRILPAEPSAAAGPEPSQAGDTIRYEPVSSRSRSTSADERRTDTQPVDEQPADEQSSPAQEQDSTPEPELNDAAAEPLPQENANEDSAAEASSNAASRTERRRSHRLSRRTWIVIAICVAAAAAIGLWLWSMNTPRARMTQALRDGDIMLACQIYDDELRDEGLTANEVYYLCAAAEKIADDFDDSPTGDSYDGRVLLLDRLGSLPYRDVQDAVAAARKRLDTRNSVLAHRAAAAEAERRGDYLAALDELEAARSDEPDDETLAAEIARLTEAYRTDALDSASQYIASGNVAQARLVLLGAMFDRRFASDNVLRAELERITNEQIQLEGSSGAARNSLDMSRLGQAAFLVEHIANLPSATSHLTVDDLAGVLMGLYQWRDYNSSPIAGTDPVLAVIRDALPERTGNAQWPLRVAERPVQLLCDALFGQRAENVNLAEALGGELFGSYKYDNGWYYYASMTVPTSSVSYADPAPLPHLQDNTYRFYSASSDRNDDRLYEMEIRPTMTSPFGFTVSSVVTVAEGRDARAEAEPAIREQETPPPSPAPSPSASAAVSEIPAEDLSAEQAPPQFDYAPEGSLTGGMVFPDSDLRYLTDNDLSAVAAVYSDVPAALELARNEIYARRGHIFDDPAYQQYFSQFAWYSPSHSVSDSELNEFERTNLQQISAWRSGG